VARTPDLALKRELLDEVVRHLAQHGLSDLSLRDIAAGLGTNASRLVHHFGTKEQLLAAALDRANEMQELVGAKWLARDPGITPGPWLTKWWRWMLASPDNLALARLGYEAAALDAVRTGVPSDVRANQVGIWRHYLEDRFMVAGLSADDARIEAVLLKALFTGLVIDLLATGDRRRLTHALQEGLGRVEARISRNMVPAG
jgi:AcrR family transcriptional regulator